MVTKKELEKENKYFRTERLKRWTENEIEQLELENFVLEEALKNERKINKCNWKTSSTIILNLREENRKLNEKPIKPYSETNWKLEVEEWKSLSTALMITTGILFVLLMIFMTGVI